MAKHTKYFYRAIARIRAINRKDGVVFIVRLMSVLKIGPLRALKLKTELVDAGVLREWNDKDLNPQVKDKKGKGNILWENLKKFRVPKNITLKEQAIVKEELKKGLL